MPPKQIAAPKKPQSKTVKRKRGRKRPNPANNRPPSIEDQLADSLHDIGARLLDGILMAGAVTLINIAEQAAASLPQLPQQPANPNYPRTGGRPAASQSSAGPASRRPDQAEPIELKRQPDGTYK